MLMICKNCLKKESMWVAWLVIDPVCVHSKNRQDTLRETIPKNICFCLEIFQRVGGSFPNPNFLRNIFVLCMFGHVSEMGGTALFQTFGETFML